VPIVGVLNTARIAGAEFRLIEDAGHWPQWEQREQFDRIVPDFLGRGG